MSSGRLGGRLAERLRATAGGEESGTAIIEFIFVAVVIMVPLVYLIAAVATVQRSQLAVSLAARNAGRAYATSDTAAQAEVRVAAAVRLAMSDQGLPDDVQVRFVAADRGCDAPRILPRLAAGAVFAVCVTRRVELPAVPSVLTGRGITTTAEAIIHIDDFRALP